MRRFVAALCQVLAVLLVVSFVVSAMQGQWGAAVVSLLLAAFGLWCGRMVAGPGRVSV